VHGVTGRPGCGEQRRATAINDNGQIVATSGGLTLLLTPN
jgi:hypothetical protein